MTQCPELLTVNHSLYNVHFIFLSLNIFSKILLEWFSELILYLFFQKLIFKRLNFIFNVTFSVNT